MFGLVRGNLAEIDAEDEPEFEIEDPSDFYGPHINQVPIQNAVQSPRLFYAAKFYNQSVPLLKPEAPLVRNLMFGNKEGRTWDMEVGKGLGAVFADDDGVVEAADDKHVVVKLADGSRKEIKLHRNTPFNRMTSFNQTPVVSVGQPVKRGGILARSNYTDEEGNLGMGANLRVGLVPYKGYSIDDATVISEAASKRLTSVHQETMVREYRDGVKGGKPHFTNLFPDKFTQKQLEMLDDDGVVKPGTALQPGDPITLATRPRSFSSQNSQMDQLSKVVRQSRRDASLVWEHDQPGVVMDVAHTKKGKKVVVSYESPMQVGDKGSFRHGQKFTISHIIPDDKMPRTEDGKPLDILLNPAGLPSRANDSTVFEVLLGKIAKMTGKPVSLPGFNEKGTSWKQIVRQQLEDNKVSETERVFDPEEHRFLENPITVGDAYILKLQHMSAKKTSARGQGSYDNAEQPAKGGYSGGGAKRRSGLETYALMSSGAYANLRDSATISGQKNDDFWRQVRQGQTPKNVGKPFVWEKFRHLLAGAGMNTKDMGEGKLRLSAFTDDDLDALNPYDFKSDKIIDLGSMQPIPGGLMDPDVLKSNKWGRIKLDVPIVNPIFEDAVRHLLGLKKKDLRAILAGEMDFPQKQ